MEQGVGILGALLQYLLPFYKGREKRGPFSCIVQVSESAKKWEGLLVVPKWGCTKVHGLLKKMHCLPSISKLMEKANGNHYPKKQVIKGLDAQLSQFISQFDVSCSGFDHKLLCNFYNNYINIDI